LNLLPPVERGRSRTSPSFLFFFAEEEGKGRGFIKAYYLDQLFSWAQLAVGRGKGGKREGEGARHFFFFLFLSINGHSAVEGGRKRKG